MKTIKTSIKKERSIIKNIKWLFFSLALGLLLGGGMAMVSAWTDPAVAPPGGNLGAPINTGIGTQTKTGNLNANGMVLAGVGNTLLVPVGRVGIGDNTPDIGTGGQLKLDVAGNVGATKYCDAAGNNCKAITEVGGSNVQNIYHGWIPTSGAFGSAGPVNLGAHDFCYFTNLTWSGAAGQCRLYQSSGVWYMQSYEGARCGATCADII